MIRSRLLFALLLSLGACGGETSKSGGETSSGGSSSQQGDERCSAGCQRITASACGDSVTTEACLSDCNATIQSASEKNCKLAMDAYLACAADASITCQSGRPYLTGCDAQDTAVSKCMGL